MFGAFIATELQERHSAQFFGTGETILFTLTPSPWCFHWTGENDFILRCNDQELIVGSGGGYVYLLSFIVQNDESFVQVIWSMAGQRA